MNGVAYRLTNPLLGRKGYEEVTEVIDYLLKKYDAHNPEIKHTCIDMRFDSQKDTDSFIHKVKATGKYDVSYHKSHKMIYIEHYKELLIISYHCI